MRGGGQLRECRGGIPLTRYIHGVLRTEVLPGPALKGAVRIGRDGEVSILGRGNSLCKGVVAVTDPEAHIRDEMSSVRGGREVGLEEETVGRMLKGSPSQGK